MLHQGFINSAGMQARATCAGQACNMPSSSAIAAQPGYVRRWLATPCASSAAVGPHPRCCAAPVPRLPHLRQLRAPVERCAGAGDFYPSAPELPPTGMGMPDDRMGETARKALARATFATKRYGWISFWVQLTLSVVSAVILLFSVAFTSQSGPRASLYLTLVGILAGFLSTFWNFGYTRTAMKMQAYLDAPRGSSVNKVKKQNVIDMVTKGVIINMLGLGSTLLGIQALVGVLVAKTLSNATANPFIASAAGVYNPVLALDVFLVQAATNTLLGHFLSLVCSLWLLNVIGEGRGLRFQSSSGADKGDSANGATAYGYRAAPAAQPRGGY